MSSTLPAPAPRRLVGLSVFAAIGLASACDGGGGGGGLMTMGMSGIPSPVVVAQNVVLVDTALDGHPGGRLLADTGSPFTLVDPGAFPGATLPATTQVTVDLSFGAFTVDKVPALQVSIGSMDTVNLAGIVGGNVFRQFATQFNYRDRSFRLGSGAPPEDVAVPGTTFPFALEGGGTVKLDATTNIPMPTTRVSLTVKIEGMDVPVILDTGASETAVTSSVFSRLTSDGRAILNGLPVSTVSGSASASVARAKTITVAGETVPNAAVMTIGDSLLVNLTAEVKHPVEGLLGGNFLREFLVTIDYPRRTITLQRYGARTHIADEFQRVGVEIRGTKASDGLHVFLATVFANSDAAARGLSVGDELVAIDGKALADMAALTVDDLLDGTPGELKQLTFGAAASAAVAQKTVAVKVDDLLPARP